MLEFENFDTNPFLGSLLGREERSVTTQRTAVKETIFFGKEFEFKVIKRKDKPNVKRENRLSL